jgi:hypothetical protein
VQIEYPINPLFIPAPLRYIHAAGGLGWWGGRRNRYGVPPIPPKNSELYVSSLVAARNAITIMIVHNPKEIINGIDTTNAMLLAAFFGKCLCRIFQYGIV